MRAELRTGRPGRVAELRQHGLPVSVGSDACPHLLPRPGQLAALDADVVVLPLAPQRHLDAVVGVGRAALELGLRLVVNDAGVLWALRDAKPRDITAGRGLVHGIEACPWADDLLRGESPLVREALMRTTFDYSRNRRLFRGLGVTRIEVDNLPRTLSVRRDWDVSVHADYAMAAYTMSCHTARELGLVPPMCREACGRPYRLELVDTFSLAGDAPGFDAPDPRVKRVFPELFVLGNGVFVRADAPLPGGVDVVVDADFYAPDELEGVIERVQPS